MQITIHRATQIGGQITRISTPQASIIIDLGHNLPNHAEDEDAYDSQDIEKYKRTEADNAIDEEFLTISDCCTTCQITYRNTLVRSPNKWFTGNTSN